MTDLPPYPDADDESASETDGGATTSTSRWVYVLGISAIVLLVLVVVLHLTGIVGPGGR